MASGHETNAEFLASEVQVRIIVQAGLASVFFTALRLKKIFPARNFVLSVALAI